jgi:hypothetical protein
VFDETTGLVQPMALAAASVPIVGYVEGHTAVLGENGDSCRPGAGSVTPDGDGVVVRILWSCAIRVPCRDYLTTAGHKSFD